MPGTDRADLVSVLMPACNQQAFLRRAIESLRAQSHATWELVIVDDGSTDQTPDAARSCLGDERIRYHRLPVNVGLGAALNAALSLARARWIAYLPCDDVYYQEHLETLLIRLAADPEALLAYSGLRHSYNRASAGQIEGRPLQLVQVLHRKTEDRWTERAELVTDDLGRMYWSKLLKRGASVGTGQVTCEWVDHPGQLHKIIQEPVGGINLYRTRFRVGHPLRFHSTVGNEIDEAAQYARWRSRPDTPRAADGLKILLVGELAYNADRILALEERGHKLYGLWMPDPYWYNTVGPLPFGHVEDLPRENWPQAVRRIQPDVIYGLLNWQAVPFVHQVLRAETGVPMVWHFKEGPFICLEKGTWDLLVDLYRGCQGRIFCSPETEQWFDTVCPGLATPSLVLDGDLPKADWFGDRRTPRISESDGEVHTVVPGRPIGLHPESIVELGREGVHVHFYGDFTHGQWRAWIERARGLAPGHLHIHPNVAQDRWVEEFSRYDAGWLHAFCSQNGGDLRRANWDDLNYPARISTLACAGLPMIQYDNSGSIVATQTLVRQHRLGLFYREIPALAAQLRDARLMSELRAGVWAQRRMFSFDDHADRLVAFFRKVKTENGR